MLCTGHSRVAWVTGGPVVCRGNAVMHTEAFRTAWHMALNGGWAVCQLFLLITVIFSHLLFPFFLVA